MTYRLRNIVLAVGLAVLAALLTVMYVTGYERRVESAQERVDVWVAKADTPPGTPAAAVKVSQSKFAREAVVPGAIASPGDVAGQITSEWIYAGEQVTARRFAKVGESGIQGDLKGNLRAFQLQGNRHQLLAGTLKENDRVDVVGVIKLAGRNDAFASRIVLRDLKVLRAAGGSGSESAIGPTDTLSVVLAVSDQQVQKLMLLTTKHDWSLELRPLVDPADSPESIETERSLLRDGLGRRNGGTR
jgi:Flp pilus assembly protein CpaB